MAGDEVTMDEAVHGMPWTSPQRGWAVSEGVTYSGSYVNLYIIKCLTPAYTCMGTHTFM